MFQNGGRGVGDKGKDNGLLIVVAVEDRRVKSRSATTLEEFVTDGFAGETIRNVITPEFRQGNYGAGLLAGATRIIDRIAERRGVTLQDVPREPVQQRRSRGIPVRHDPVLDHARDHLQSPRPWTPSPILGRRALERLEQRHRAVRRGRRIRRRLRRIRRGGGFGGGGGGGFGGFGGGRSGGGGASGGW